MVEKGNWRAVSDVLIMFKSAIITISQEISYAKQFLSEAGSVPAFVQS